MSAGALARSRAEVADLRRALLQLELRGRKSLGVLETLSATDKLGDLIAEWRQFVSHIADLAIEFDEALLPFEDGSKPS